MNFDQISTLDFELAFTFPFKCNTPGCSKDFTKKRFLRAAKNSGYIHLTNSKNSFVGLTCPKCGKTTIRKYSGLKDLTFVNESGFTNFIPFFTEKFPNRQLDSSKDLYHVPDTISEWKLTSGDIFYQDEIAYPKWFHDSCVYYFDEKDIPEIVEFENTESFKVFPRIINSDSIYNTTDCFLFYTPKNFDYADKTDILPAKIKDELKYLAYFKEENDILDEVESPAELISLNQLLLGIVKDDYLTDPNSSLTEEEFRDLDAFYRMAPDFSDNFVEKILDMLFEYVQVRSRLDFETTYKTDFLDKYIKEFYYSEGYGTSKQKIIDRIYYEDIIGSAEKRPIRINLLDNKDADEILTHSEILQRWNKDISILKNFIISDSLPAYRFNGVWLNPISVDFDADNVQPENYLYKKSEVEELELLCEWLKKGKKEIKEQSENEEKNPINKEEIKELEQLRFEKEKWDVSINAAVKIGIWAGEEDGPFKVKTVKDKIESIETEIHSTAFEIIWEAIPTEKRDSGIENQKIISEWLEKDKTDTEGRNSLTAKEKRELGQLKNEKIKWDASIEASFQIGMWVASKKDPLKRNEIKDKLYELDSSIPTTTFEVIRNAIPPEKRRRGGRPKKNKCKKGKGC
jgi:hypothetical protein